MGASKMVMWAEAPFLRGEAVGLVLVQAGEGKASQGPDNSLPVLTRRLSRRWSHVLYSDGWQESRDVKLK